MLDPNLNKEELDNILAQCLINIKTCCGVIFPDIFYAPFSILHQQIFDIVDQAFSMIAQGKKKIAIAAPRGIGKTSIARTIANRSILYRLCNFIVYLSNSATSAEMQTENMKRDLITNKMVRQLFGNIKDSIDTEDVMDESFSKKAWTAYGSTFVLPRGAGQQVRGLNWANNRPGLVIIDDLEDKNEIQSVENRKKLKEWFWSDLMKTEDRYGDGCIFIYIDTIKHEDSLLVDLLDSPDWASVQLSICDQNYKSLDQNYMTDAEVLEEVEEHRRLGTLDSFYMERMNIPIALEDAIFKQSYFRYFEDQKDKLVVYEKVAGENEEKRIEIKTKNLLHVTIVDPAKTVKIQSAETSIQTIAVDRSSRRIFFREIVSARMYPDEIYNEMFRQVLEFKSFILGYEVTGLNEFIIQPIESECRVRGIFPLLLQLQAKKGQNEKGKIERIKTLAPLYRLGYMYHNKSNCGPLEMQLLGFPRSKLWDVMDGAAYITHIMDSQSVHFDPTDDPETYKNELEEDEYAELFDDEDGFMTSARMGLLI